MGDTGQKRRFTPQGNSGRKKIVKSTYSDVPISGQYIEGYRFPCSSLKPLFKHLSHLERLPTEILEVIYGHVLTLSADCGFLSLPRASLSLGKQLASDYIRRQVFLRICSDEPGQLLRSGSVRQEISKEHIKAQSWILRQPWLTLEFVEQLIPEFMVSTVGRVMEGHRLPFINIDSWPLMSPTFEPAIRDFLSTADHSDPFDDTNPCHDFFETGYAFQRWDETLPNSNETRIRFGICPSEGAISLDTIPDHGSEFEDSWRILSLHHDTQIPERLLQGPWTREKKTLLRLLVVGGASVDWVKTTAGETANQGFIEAILEKDHHAMELLCFPDRNYCKHSGVGVIPTQEDLILAINEGCHEDTVQVLLSAPKSECHLQDMGVMLGIYELRKKGLFESAEWLSQKRVVDQQWRRKEPEQTR